MAGSEGMQKMLPETHPKRKHPLHPLCARTAFSCNKLFLFIYALLFLFVGIILIAIGVLVEFHRDRIEPVNNRLAVPTALLIVVGLLIAINALCGMIGTIMEKPLLLKIFLVVTVICFLAQIAIGIIAFIYREQLPYLVSSHFQFAIKGYTKDKDIQVAVDWLQTRYKCCGFSSYADYQKENEEFKCSSGTPQACGVPKSCCIQREGVFVPEGCGYDVALNATQYDMINTEGCTDALIQWLMEHLDLVGAIALGFAIPQIFGILLSYYFLRKVKEYRVWFRVDNNFRT
ncbi:tetraspanin-15-like isoform X1 [Biomphalaria pfeifferi]|uniref:Tetraspanin n=1 Tax=Biomphalaria pfeifferi TaxID=112525 RepID=A0AAD8F431_BIOPF|nr:tetraspanin-15-like isoform X1 [Biomphalaria pfeifferi]